MSRVSLLYGASEALMVVSVIVLAAAILTGNDEHFRTVPLLVYASYFLHLQGDRAAGHVAGDDR